MVKRSKRKDVTKPTKITPVDKIVILSNESVKITEGSISNRKKLTRFFLEEIEHEIEEAIRMLRHLGDPWHRGDKPEYEFMRVSLDKALTARKKERRERLLQEWKDLLELHQKRIELLKENYALSTIDKHQLKKRK